MKDPVNDRVNDRVMTDATDATDAARPRRPGRSRKGGGATSGRRRAREFALQGLYAHLIGGGDAGVVDAHVREQEGFAEADLAHYDKLLHGTIDAQAALDALIAPHLDRPLEQVSPVEHAALLIATLELRDCIEIPYRVCINEGVELAKSFGGTDGHKFVNGVLDRIAAGLRTVEIEAARRG